MIRKILHNILAYGNKEKQMFTKNVPMVEQSCFKDNGLGNWYSPVVVCPKTIGSIASSADCLKQVIEVMKKLDPDDYTQYLLSYFNSGLSRFGEQWCYADITTVLLAACKLIRPKNYLEIGVRRGRSMAMVASTCPECEIVGFDMWSKDYAGIKNPGQGFVRKELIKIGYRGKVEFISGNSHETVPAYLKQHKDHYFDLITVDGDHTASGAARDLRDVMPRLKIGGILVFDDITHPKHPNLSNIWSKYVRSDPRFSCWEYRELGYGVALAIRKY